MGNGKKILHICTIDKGGAYNGARRLNEMLIEHGYDSRILVRTMTGNSSYTFPAFRSTWEETLSKVKNVVNLCFKKGEVKRDVLGSDLTGNAMVKEADVIFIHWISTFLSPKQIYELSGLKDKKVIFWMHDMWLFTGGCHVDRRCGRYTDECTSCPMAGKPASVSFRRKKDYIQKASLTVTGPSRWIVDEASKSSILKGKDIRYIPNVYDQKVFCPKEDINTIRGRLAIKTDKKVIMFGAADKGAANSNKGFSYLLKALEMIDMSDKQLVVLGNAESIKNDLGSYDVIYPGFISDEELLADYYRAADVFVNPSLQESFGYTVCESMACGTPAVAFAVGGMLDQIESGINGYLADYENSEGLAKGIEFCVENKKALSLQAADAAKRFSYENGFDSIKNLLEE